MASFWNGVCFTNININSCQPCSSWLSSLKSFCIKYSKMILHCIISILFATQHNNWYFIQQFTIFIKNLISISFHLFLLIYITHIIHNWWHLNQKAKIFNHLLLTKDFSILLLVFYIIIIEANFGYINSFVNWQLFPPIYKAVFISYTLSYTDTITLNLYDFRTIFHYFNWNKYISLNSSSFIIFLSVFKFVFLFCIVLLHPQFVPLFTVTFKITDNQICLLFGNCSKLSFNFSGIHCVLPSPPVVLPAI